MLCRYILVSTLQIVILASVCRRIQILHLLIELSKNATVCCYQNLIIVILLHIVFFLIFTATDYAAFVKLIVMI